MRWQSVRLCLWHKHEGKEVVEDEEARESILC